MKQGMKRRMLANGILPPTGCQTSVSTAKKTAIPKERQGGYKNWWRAADVLEFTSHGYDGYVFDAEGNQIDFKGYRADCINDFALEYLDQKPRRLRFPLHLPVGAASSERPPLL